MPSKAKNTRKRSRDDSDRQQGGLPKKRAKKTAPNTDETTLRRSTRTQRKTKEWWKGTSSPSGSEDGDSTDSDITYNVPTRRRGAGSRSQRNKKESTKSRKKESAKRSKSSNSRGKKAKTSERTKSARTNKGSHSQSDTESNGPINASTLSDDVEEIEVVVPSRSKRKKLRDRGHHSDGDGEVPSRKERDLSSPHRKQRVQSLPSAQFEELMISTDRHQESLQNLFDGASGSGFTSSTLKELKAVLMESGSLQKRQSEIGRSLSAESESLRRSGTQCRSDLNSSIEAINGQYVALKKQFESDRNQNKSKMAKFERVQRDQKENGNGNEEEAEYKILYEASQQKVKVLAEEVGHLRNEMARTREEMERMKAKAESTQIEIEKSHRGEVQRLMTGHGIEVNELEVALKCAEDQFADFKANSTAKAQIERNADRLLIDNLKRENEALTNELKGIRQSMDTLSPHSAAAIASTPYNAVKRGNDGTESAVNGKGDDLKDYGQHIRESPLNERVQNELLTIWKRKDLEKSIKNLQSELDSTKTQLQAKRALIAHFEALIGGQQSEQKAMLQQNADFKKIVNLYSVLTATKIERNVEDQMRIDKEEDDGGDSKEQEVVTIKQESFSCRTAHRERGTLMEYELSFGCNDGRNEEASEASPFLDYRLLSVHNLNEKPLNESLRENITFYAKNAPLFMDTVIRQMFGK